MGKTFAQNVIDFDVPDDPLNRVACNAITRYMTDGLIQGNQIQVRACVQPLARFRLLLQMSSALGIDLQGLSTPERIPYDGKIPGRFPTIIRELSPWYSSARILKEAISSSMSIDEENICVTGAMDKRQLAFVTNITNLVRSTLNGKLATVHRVKANLEILAYMVTWHMTVSANMILSATNLIILKFTAQYPFPAHLKGLH